MVLVPERHKDGAIHLHGFFNDALPLVDSGTISRPGGQAAQAAERSAGGAVARRGREESVQYSGLVARLLNGVGALRRVSRGGGVCLQVCSETAGKDWRKVVLQRRKIGRTSGILSGYQLSGDRGARRKLHILCARTGLRSVQRI